jgi:hypothetical protein
MLGMQLLMKLVISSSYSSVWLYLFTPFTQHKQECLKKTERIHSFVRICRCIRSQNTALVYLGLLVGRVVVVVSYPQNIWIFISSAVETPYQDLEVWCEGNKTKYSQFFLYHLLFLNKYHFITFLQASSFSVHCHVEVSLSVDLELSRILSVGSCCGQVSWAVFIGHSFPAILKYFSLLIHILLR